MPAQLSEAPAGVAQCTGHPAQSILAILSALDVARVVPDRAVQVLDRVCGVQHSAQRTGDLQTPHGQRFLQPLAQAGRSTPVLGQQRRGQALRLLLGQPGRLSKAMTLARASFDIRKFRGCATMKNCSKSRRPQSPGGVYSQRA